MARSPFRRLPSRLPRHRLFRPLGFYPPSVDDAGETVAEVEKRVSVRTRPRAAGVTG